MRRQQLLRVEPCEDLFFRFERREDLEASSTFRIRNDSESRVVAFKVRTTDRSKFTGGPSYGILMAGTYCDVKVTVRGQVEALFNTQREDTITINSLQLRDNVTEESIPRLFREQANRVQDSELTVVYAMHQKPSNFEIGIIVVFTCLAFWYFGVEILSRIRTLISLIIILVLRIVLWMMRSRAVDAAEEWIRSTLLYLCLCLLAAVREYVLDLCLRWLRVIYGALLGLCASLYLFVFGPEERRTRRRRRN